MGVKLLTFETFTHAPHIIIVSHAPLKHTICRSFFVFTVLWVLCCTLSALTNVYLWWYPESLGAVELDLGAVLHMIDQHAMSVLVDYSRGLAHLSPHFFLGTIAVFVGFQMETLSDYWMSESSSEKVEAKDA